MWCISIEFSFKKLRHLVQFFRTTLTTYSQPSIQIDCFPILVTAGEAKYIEVLVLLAGRDTSGMAGILVGVTVDGSGGGEKLTGEGWSSAAVVGGHGSAGHMARCPVTEWLQRCSGRCRTNWMKKFSQNNFQKNELDNS